MHSTSLLWLLNNMTTHDERFVRETSELSESRQKFVRESSESSKSSENRQIVIRES